MKRLIPLLALLAAALPAQIITTLSGAAPSNTGFTNWNSASGQLKLGVALPSIPHAAVFWNFAGVSFDRLGQHNGGGLETGLEAWLSPARQPAQSLAPLLLAEVDLGRRWGYGLHGYSSLGAGVGWSLHNWVPYVELRRRAGFQAASPVYHELVIGLHFVLFG